MEERLRDRKLRREDRTMSVQVTGIERWQTEQLLAAYERVFGALDRKTRRRIVETARARGWDQPLRRSAYEESLPVAA
jgi:hypothetical protein